MIQLWLSVLHSIDWVCSFWGWHCYSVTVLMNMLREHCSMSWWACIIFTTATFSLCGNTHILTACCRWFLFMWMISIWQYMACLFYNDTVSYKHLCLRGYKKGDTRCDHLIVLVVAVIVTQNMDTVDPPHNWFKGWVWCYCQQLPWKGQNQQCVTPSLNTCSLVSVLFQHICRCNL